MAEGVFLRGIELPPSPPGAAHHRRHGRISLVSFDLESVAVVSAQGQRGAPGLHRCSVIDKAETPWLDPRFVVHPDQPGYVTVTL